MNAREADFEQAKNDYMLFKTKLRSALPDPDPSLFLYGSGTLENLFGAAAFSNYTDIAEIKQVAELQVALRESALLVPLLYKQNKNTEAGYVLSKIEADTDHLISLLTIIELKLKFSTGTTQPDAGLKYNVEKQLRDNFSQAPVAICILSGTDFTVELANSLFLQIAGRDEKFIRQPVFKAFPELEAQGFKTILTDVYNNVSLFSGNEIPVSIHRNGGKDDAFFNFIFQPLKDDAGFSGRIMIVCSEVTSQVIAKQSINESERKLQIAIDAAELGTFDLNLKTREVHLSDRYLSILGFEPSENPSHQQLLDTIDPAFLHTRNEAMKQAMITGAFSYDMRLIWRDGSIRWITAKGKIFYDANKIPEKALGTILDITQAKLAQEKIESATRRLEIALDAGELGTYEVDLKTNNVIYSERYLTIFGYAAGERPGREQLLLQIHPLDKAGRDENTRLAMVTGVLDHEIRIFWPDGSLHWLKIKGRVFYDEQKQPEKMLGTVLDVTESNLARERITKANRTLEIALDAASLGSFELDLATGKSNFNLTCKENFGFEPGDDVTLQQVVSVVHPDDRKKMQDAMDHSKSTGERYTAEYRILLKDKSVRWLSSSGKWIYNTDGKATKLIGVNANITERKNAEEALQLSFEKFKLLADSMPQFVWTGDAAGNLNYFNQSVFDYSGLSPEEISAEGWLQIVHPDDRDMNIKKWTYAVRSGQDFLFEHRFKKHDGEYRWQLSRAIAQRNKEGGIQMWVGTSTDIQDQKTFSQQLETLVRERTKALKQANIDLEIMNQELSAFAYISSHDLQEPLRKIQTFISRIEESDFETMSGAGKKYFERVQHSANKMKTLINDLLTYSKTNASEKVFERVDLNVLLQDIKNEFSEALEEKHAVLKISEMPEIKCIPFQMRQLFINLISNALKFSGEQVVPAIKISSVLLKGSDTANKNAHELDDYWRITVSDNGIGFKPEYNEKIFEVFQKLNNNNTTYEGTGIGLSICKKIAENHHGFIEATSEPGSGATFSIYIPTGAPQTKK